MIDGLWQFSLRFLFVATFVVGRLELFFLFFIEFKVYHLTVVPLLILLWVEAHGDRVRHAWL